MNQQALYYILIAPGFEAQITPELQEAIGWLATVPEARAFTFWGNEIVLEDDDEPVDAEQ